MKFNELKVKQEILQALDDLGFQDAFPIQEKSIPPALEGKDVIGKAQTGSGKTIAFAIPILEKISAARMTQALIIAPTRELVVQICGEISKLSKHLHIKNVAVYGGKSIEGQASPLRQGVQIVVATPGRLIDHMQRGNIDLRHIRVLVLDEADRMLDMGFIEDIEYIISKIPSERQTMLFSATIPDRIKSTVHRYMKSPVTVELNKESILVSTVKQVAYIVNPTDKIRCLEKILDSEKSVRSLIFCSTKVQARKLAHIFSKRHDVAAIHGDLSQNQREHVLNAFRNNKISHLVATDVAARGLDIEGISHVINFDIPDTVESYVHRIGRTARAGAAGMAITLVFPGEVMDILRVEHECKANIEKMHFANGGFMPVDPDAFHPSRAIVPRGGSEREQRGFGGRRQGGFRRGGGGFRRGGSGGFRRGGSGGFKGGGGFRRGGPGGRRGGGRRR